MMALGDVSISVKEFLLLCRIERIILKRMNSVSCDLQPKVFSQIFIHCCLGLIGGLKLNQDLHRTWFRKGLIYLGMSGGLLAYALYVIAIRSNAPPLTYTPFEQLQMVPAMFIGGFVTFILFGLGLYYIIKAASQSNIT